ncbi:MAG: beta-galactosidase [Chloroflexi bacterium]|nr:MAG: beta-galactosidase [Chloroflexota bacterium]MBL1196233.1 beta-galactosidase [Chloroflexota bacterium]NOH13527.1 beta-galactosidase [Chloroflexota bacterium]
MEFGVCYYPEHWPPERWSVDAQMMREAGIRLVRIAEFAWQQMEPAEGHFEWDWLDQAIEVLAAQDLQIILGTPTAAPPAWLSHAYPEILLVDSEGRQRRFGSRRHYCPTQPTYHQHAKRIVGAMVERYAQHPAVVGWQIDNEFGDHETARCYCDACSNQFRTWLTKRYKNIDALNYAWGTDFWSQAYSDWEQIELPNLTITDPNPSQVLDFYRYSSDAYLQFQQFQIDIIRAHDPKIPINTNFMGNFADLNYHDLSNALDLVTWDSYPTGYADVHAWRMYAPGEARPEFAYDVGDPYITGFSHAIMYGLKQAPFWIMEQQCGNINWSSYNEGIRPGTTRLWTWHALASGADAVVYFRWRASLNAQEQYHSGFLRHDASPAQAFEELISMQPEQEQMRSIAAEQLNAEVAILLDYNDLWSVQIQPHRKDFSHMRHLFVYYRALQRLGIPTAIVSPDSDLSQYKLVLAPSLILGDTQRAELLGSYVEDGGSLLLGIRSGFKTPSNRVTDLSLPGVFQPLMNVSVQDWHALSPKAQYPLKSHIAGLNGAATIWAERLESNAAAEDAGIEVLASYAGGPFDGGHALTARSLGLGKALYMGWYPTEDQAVALLAHLAQEADVPRLAELPHGLLAAKRGENTILMNFMDETLSADVQGKHVDVAPRDVQVI